MTLLAAAVQIRDRYITVDTVSPTEQPFQFTIDAETFTCTQGGGTLIWAVDRHVNGSKSAAHLNGATVLETAPLTVSTAAVTPSAVGQIFATELAFAENGAGTYIGTIPIPAGATVTDVIFRNTVVWAAATSASMTCGDADAATGYFTATSVKTVPAADTTGAGAGLSARGSLGASAGAFKGAAGKFYAAAGLITCTIVSVGAGTTGRSRLYVEYALPFSKLITQ